MYLRTFGIYMFKFSVFLNKQRVKAPIGWYEEERESGVELLISVKAQLAKTGGNDNLSDTLDYVSLVNIVNEQSSIETHLLETLAERIIENIFQLKPNLVCSVYVMIEKPHIPHPSYAGQACGIELEKINPNFAK